MAVRSNSLMPFSIQAILNKKEDSRHLQDLDMCISKTACWKIFAEMDHGSEDFPGACRSEVGTCIPSDQKSYDSDSGLSDDNDSKTRTVCKSEKDRNQTLDVLEESLHEETDHESAVLENVKGLGDCDPNVSGVRARAALQPSKVSVWSRESRPGCLIKADGNAGEDMVSEQKI